MNLVLHQQEKKKMLTGKVGEVRGMALRHILIHRKPVLALTLL